MTRRDPSFASGVSELLILQLLAQKEMYGYELAKAVQTTTAKAIRLGEGALYPLLHALEAQHCLHSRRQKVDGRTRVYYSATPKGRRRLEQLAGQWRRVATGVMAALGGLTHA